MCFSASASYTASALLLLCGLASLHKAPAKQIMFAAIPLLFSFQQFFEGLIWQGFSDYCTPTVAIYGFLFFVYVIWPLWVPCAIRQMATKKSEKKAIFWSIIAGIILAFVAVWYGITQPISAALAHHHITYTSQVPEWLWIPGTICYFIATIVPFFIVKAFYLRFIGITLALSYVITFLFFYHAILSVWCFFVAILSVLVLMARRAS